jgi:hypothetical protein
MALIYNVTIEPGDKEGGFHIAWQKWGTHQRDVFDQQAGDISQEKVERLWQQPRYQPDVGRKLFRFLDGDNRCLQRALDEAHRKGETLQLDLCACDRTADWPFELLAGEGGFLLPDRMHLVRCVSGYGAAKKIIPQDRPLKLLFMACSALDVEPELDFEKEEDAILDCPFLHMNHFLFSGIIKPQWLKKN